ncbi:ATP-binding protein [Arthrobacter sp. Sa2CUA1]|uniref:ATP-binding protein n=1 Tax=Arthrobacter gallicola TaxID=2762225 RepID=A0ABR8UVP9_9MICC|nr:ATP-binding protein [Arthrobacter gallicola]
MDGLGPPETSSDLMGDRAWLTALLSSAQAGRGEAGVLRGDAGVGKTFLVSSVAAENPHLRMRLVRGAEAEANLPYAALQRIILAHRGALDQLAEAHRAALVTACGIDEGPGLPAASRSLIGLGLLDLFGVLCREAPLLYFIDDAQWVDPDSLQVLAFAARRLTAERIALLFAVRANGREPGTLDDLPGRTLTGLSREAAFKLLAGASPTPLDRRVADRLITATGGNPLAMLDLLADLSAQQLRGEELLPDPVPVGQRLAGYYLRQDGCLPSETRKWLLTAATEPDGDLEAIAAAGKSMGLREDASRAAELAGLARVGAQPSPSTIPWCARLSITVPPATTSAVSTGIWQRRQSAAGTRTGGCCTGQRRPSDPTTRLPANSRKLQIWRHGTADIQHGQRSCFELPPSPPPARTRTFGCWRPPNPQSPPVRVRRLGPCCGPSGFRGSTTSRGDGSCWSRVSWTFWCLAPDSPTALRSCWLRPEFSGQLPLHVQNKPSAWFSGLWFRPMTW